MTASITRSTTASRAIGVGVAVLAAVFIWVIAVPLLGVDLQVVQGGPPQAVGLVAVIVTSLLAGLLGWGLLAVLTNRLGNGRRIWTVVAVVGALLSLAGPITSAVGAAATVTLLLLHVVVAAVLISTLPRDAR